jgi:hypothetical protein
MGSHPPDRQDALPRAGEYVVGAGATQGDAERAHAHGVPGTQVHRAAGRRHGAIGLVPRRQFPGACRASLGKPHREPTLVGFELERGLPVIDRRVVLSQSFMEDAAQRPKLGVS